MLSDDRVRQLVHDHHEITIADFKSEMYRFDIDEKKSEFIIDILSMANTPREDAAYIVIGVKLSNNGSRELKSIVDHCDDADLHEYLNRAGVNPRPEFTYHPVEIDGGRLGIIEIRPAKMGPYLATKDFNKVRADKIYYRDGTQNKIASTAAEINHISNWFRHSQSPIPIQPSDLHMPNSVWNKFFHACHKFGQDRILVLVVGPNDSLSGDDWSSIASLPLSLVLDFDVNTQENGAYAASASILKKHRSVHLWTASNITSMHPQKACYWFAAKGLSSDSLSLLDDGWRNWNRKYGQKTQDLFEALVRSSMGDPITFVSLWDAPEYLRELCASLDRVAGNAVEYVFVKDKSSALDSLADQFDATLIESPVNSILFSISQNIGTDSGERPIITGIPNVDGTFVSIEVETLRWLEEDLDVLHTNCEIQVDIDTADTVPFLRGSRISWHDLDLHVDAERDVVREFVSRIQRELESRSNSRVNLYHWPGAGGTTVARRIGWDLHRQFPVVLLRRIVRDGTTSRIREIFRLTSQSILAIVEGADVTQDSIEQLYSELRSENIPIVFLHIVRRSTTPTRSERNIYLLPGLSARECYRFAQVYKSATPEKQSALDAIAKANPELRTPFGYAFTAFGKDFLGLESYVRARLSGATNLQLEILIYLALSYYYGHKSVPAQLFAVHLGLPENRPIRLDNDLLSKLQLELMIHENMKTWRPVHHLIAEKILEIALSGDGDIRTWKRNLVAWSRGFIELCAESAEVPSDFVVDLLRRIFILRNESEILGTEVSGSATDYSSLISDIQTDEGRLAVLQQLVEYFPEEAHFWGHLGRFYSNTMREPVKAIECIDRAILISPNDPVLHHMKGMCFRSIVYDQIDSKRHTASLAEGKLLIEQQISRALDAFQQSRELDPGSEYAFVSPIQMLLRAIDFGYGTSGAATRIGFLSSPIPAAQWYRELLDEAEYLLEEVKRIREGESPSGLILHCDASIIEMYDDYSRALESWTNLLGRNDIYAPPIRRQIARAYLTRKERQWDKLPAREIERIIDLMEDNLREEPNSDRNIRIWFRAIRYTQNFSIDLAIDRIANWRATGDAPDAYFFLYVLHVLKALDGSTIETQRAQDLIEQSRKRSRNLRSRTRSHEWLGYGNGLGRLINSSELGDWEESTAFYGDVDKLIRCRGRVKEIKAPEAGELELESTGLSVFFVPARAQIVKGRDENRLVTFYLGFSYDGLRAWSVGALTE